MTNDEKRATLQAARVKAETLLETMEAKAAEFSGSFLGRGYAVHVETCKRAIIDIDEKLARLDNDPA